MTADGSTAASSSPTPKVFDYIDGDDTVFEREPTRAAVGGRPAVGVQARRLLVRHGHAVGQDLPRPTVGRRQARRGSSGSDDDAPVESMNRCRFCDAAAGGRRSATSACRRWPTPTRRRPARRREAVLPAARYVCSRVPAGAARRSSSRPSTSSATTRTSRRTRRAGWSTPAATSSRWSTRFGLGRGQPGGGDRQQRRLPAAVLRASAACPSLGIEPAANVADGGAGARDPDAGRVLRHGAGDDAGRRAARRPTCCSATTSWPTCPTSTTSSAGMARAPAPTGVHHDGVPASAPADRATTSSTPSTTSTSRTSRSSPCRARLRAPRSAHLRRRGAPHPRRLAADLRRATPATSRTRTTERARLLLDRAGGRARPARDATAPSPSGCSATKRDAAALPLDAKESGDTRRRPTARRRRATRC